MDSLSTFETKLNHALEQNALLENELDDKQQANDKGNSMIYLYLFYFFQLTETVQRLRDETRDLHEELHVLHKNNERTGDTKPPRITNSNRMQSILSEAAAEAAATSASDSTIRGGNFLSTKKEIPSYPSICSLKSRNQIFIFYVLDKIRMSIFLCR